MKTHSFNFLCKQPIDLTMIPRILTLILLLIGPAIHLGAQELVEDSETEPEAPPPALPAAGELVMPTSEMTIDFESNSESSLSQFDDEKISVDFPDEEIRVIIQNVADLYDLNVVIPDTLTGRKSLKLREVEWRQVFEVVLEPEGFTWIEDRNIIIIKSIEDVQNEPLDTRIFIINNAGAAELQGSIAPLVDTALGGRLQVDSRANALVITERQTQMNKIQNIIDQLDKKTEQVMIESKFIEVTNRDVENIGINWTSLNGYTIGGGPFQRQYIRDYQKERENGVDSGVDSDNTSEITVDNTNGTTTNTTTITTSGTDISTDNVLTSIATGRLDSAVFSADAFNVVLSALGTLADIELVSNPTVVTLNNTPAEINIGEEFPIPEYNFNQQTGSFEVSGFEYKPIGIILDVTPQVNNEGFINLTIAPEISSRTGTVNFGGSAGAEIPIITTRRTASVVTIKDNFTLAIGGLMERTTSNETSRVPVVSRIPGLGRLFKNKAYTEDSRNLIIFITARVLNPDGSTYKDVFDERRLASMGVQESDIPGYQLPLDQENLYREIRESRENLDNLSRDQALRKQLNLLDELEETEDVDRYNSDPAARRRMELVW